MALMLNLLMAGKATSTHHKLALDALRNFTRHDAEDWRNLFLSENEAFLRGSKAPDNEFKDFKNHVLHVRENFWGGAIAKAQEWYEKTVQSLKQRQWPDAAYNAGVLSHYVTDPLQPFHTGQSEREMIVHRAAEWSIAKSYEELQGLLTKELGGYPEVKLAAGEGWLPQFIRDGATQANASYEFLIDHYNLEVGTKNPPLGYDREAKLVIAKLIGLAAVGFSRVLERAIADAGVFVPHVVIGPKAMFESLRMPVHAVTKRMLDSRERATVEAMYAEYQRTGKVLETLPDDDKIIRQLHAEEVLKVPLAELNQQKPAAIGTKYTGPAPAPAKPAAKAAAPKVKELAAAKAEGKPAAKSGQRDDLTAPKLAPLAKEAAPAKPVAAAEPVAATAADTSSKRVALENPLADAPSIGPKTAARFAAIGIHTIGDFLAGEPKAMAASLKVSHITEELLEQWQEQTQLVVDIPRLLGREAQLLVGVGVRSSSELANMNARQLFDLVKEFCQTSEGERVLRGAIAPDLVQVSQWVVLAKKGRMAKAA